MKFRGALPTFLILLLTGTLWAQGSPSGTPKGVDQSKKELGGIKKRILEERQRVQAISKKESSVISQLNTLDRNLAEKEKELRGLRKKLTSLRETVERSCSEGGCR